MEPLTVGVQRQLMLSLLLLMTQTVTSTMNSRSLSSKRTSLVSHGQDGGSKSPVSNSASTNSIEKTDVYLLVLVPANRTSIFSIDRIRPAISLAVKSDDVARILPFHNLVTFFEDSACHIAAAMNRAIIHYIQGTVNAFIGPVCDYSIAPVARQAKYWNLPVISSGAMAQNFKQKRYDLYNTLTRTGPNYNTLIAFVARMFKHFSYNKVHIMYEPAGMNHVIDKMCHVMADSMHRMFKSPKMGYNISNDYSKMEERKQIKSILESKVGVDYASE